MDPLKVAESPDNSLVEFQNTEGPDAGGPPTEKFPVVGFAFWTLALVSAVSAAIVWYGRSRVSAAVIVIAGLVALGLAIYEGTGDRTDIHAAGGELGPILPRLQPATPSWGIYAVGLGGILLACAGVWLIAAVVRRARQTAGQGTAECRVGRGALCVSPSPIRFPA